MRNRVKAAIEEDKANYQLQLVKSFRGNPKRFYGYVRSMQTVKTRVSSLQKADGTKTTTDEQTAEVLSAHFQDAFVKETDTHSMTSDPATEDMTSLQMEFNEELVLKKLQRLKPDKS